MYLHHRYKHTFLFISNVILYYNYNLISIGRATVLHYIVLHLKLVEIDMKFLFIK